MSKVNSKGYTTAASISAGMLRAMLRVNDEAGMISLPLFIFHGSDDRIVYTIGDELLFDKVVSKEKNIKLYKNLYHEVHNEPERVTMFNDLQAWLTTRS